jgi:hypothetical protein
MPDLDQIKQGEQVTTSALKGSAWRFAGIASVEITGAVEVLAFSFGNYCTGCYLSAKTARSGRGRPVCERAVRQWYRPHPTVSTNRATWAAEPLLCQIR